MKKGLILNKVVKGNINIMRYAIENDISHIYVLREDNVYKKYTINQFIKKYGFYIDITEAERCIVVTEGALWEIKREFARRIGDKLKGKVKLHYNEIEEETLNEIKKLRENNQCQSYMLSFDYRNGVKVNDNVLLHWLFRGYHYEQMIMLKAQACCITAYAS